MAPRVFGCTYFVQDLSPGFNKLSPWSTNVSVLGILELRKGNGTIILTTESIVSANITFFESISYFSPHSLVTASEPIPILPSVLLLAFVSVLDVSLPVSPEDTTEPPALKPLWDFKYVHDTSSVKEPHPQSSAPPSDLDVPIALCKGKRSCIVHLIFHFASYDRLNPSFRQFALSLCSIYILRS